MATPYIGSLALQTHSRMKIIEGFVVFSKTNIKKLHFLKLLVLKVHIGGSKILMRNSFKGEIVVLVYD